VLLRPLSWIKVEGEARMGRKVRKGGGHGQIYGGKERRWGDRFPEKCGEILNSRLVYF